MNLQVSNKLDLAIALYKSLSETSITQRQFTGTLDQSINFDEAINQLENFSMIVSEDRDSRKIEFHLPPNFFLNIDDLLGAPSRRHTAPASFYLADLDFKYSENDDDAPEGVKNYLQATQVFQSLRKISHEITTGSDIELFIIQKEKLSISTTYKKDHLKKILKLDDFNSNFINSEIHKDQKSTIIKSSITEFFNKRDSIDLSEIIDHFDEIYATVNNSYQMYVSEFSFIKIKTEMEKEKMEFTTKLNKVFSDIQNQLLAIPAALILVGGQMEKSTDWTIKNILIWLGALVFSLLMNLLVKNQNHTLRAVKHEIDQQKNLIKTKHQSIADKFSYIYIQLNSRYEHQQKLIKTIDGMVAASLLIATYLLIYFSTNEYLPIFSIFIGIVVATMVKIEILFKEKSLARDSNDEQH